MVDMTYIPSPTGKIFHQARNVDNGFVRGLMGPIGSGKSVTCVLDLLLIAMDQEPDINGVRRSRFGIIRNTYRELLDTTVETFFTWIQKDSGQWSSLNMLFKTKQPLPDGTIMDIEFLFRALDKPDDIKKLLSLELTAAWINEAREISKTVVDMVQGRVGRYPPKVLGPQATFFGLIMDTNPPDSDHWWYTLFEEKSPSNHKLFKQPSGVSPKAENVHNLPRNYYKNMQSGKDQEWINVYVHGQYGFVSDGKPVYPEYHDNVHATSDDLYELLIKTTSTSKLQAPTVYIGIDFGLTPAAAIGYITTSGQMQLIDELVTFDMGAMNFGKLLREKLNTSYAGFDIEIFGDPAGDQRAQTDEITPFQILSNQGVMATPTYTNDPLIRREAVADYLTRLDFNGEPCLMIGHRAKMTRKAFSGGYKYRRMQVTGDSRFQDKPDKGKYSHISDAVQYLFLGAVGGSNVVGGFDNSKPLEYGPTGIT